jgi:hypothetical protein
LQQSQANPDLSLFLRRYCMQLSPGDRPGQPAKMMPDWWPGEIHDRFMEWAISQGVIVNGIAPARFPGSGLGMISTRAIEVCHD